MPSVYMQTNIYYYTTEVIVIPLSLYCGRRLPSGTPSCSARSEFTPGTHTASELNNFSGKRTARLPIVSYARQAPRRGLSAAARCGLWDSHSPVAAVEGDSVRGSGIRRGPAVGPLYIRPPPSRGYVRDYDFQSMIASRAWEERDANLYRSECDH